MSLSPDILAVAGLEAELDLRPHWRADVLPRSFYRQPTETVARSLLGKVLAHRTGGRLLAGVITEVEAYFRHEDAASHSARGETPRNRSMFLGGGHCYVYLSYGVNHCVNVVTGKPGQGDAVLIRALRPLQGLEIMAARRGLVEGARPALSLTNGPGKLTQALGIGLELDGDDLCTGPLRIIDPGLAVSDRGVIRTPRIGITKAADLPLRYLMADCPWVSRRGKVPPPPKDRGRRS